MPQFIYLRICVIIECNLPDNFQSWFSVTQLHVWMLMVHLRAEGQGKLYIQELVNRFFEDAEGRIRQHGVSSIFQCTNVNEYMLISLLLT
jgi:hypothetical protein